MRRPETVRYWPFRGEYPYTHRFPEPAGDSNCLRISVGCSRSSKTQMSGGSGFAIRAHPAPVTHRFSYCRGWGGRIRTYGWRLQRPLPYHLATPQCYWHLIAAVMAELMAAWPELPPGT